MTEQANERGYTLLQKIQEPYREYGQAKLRPAPERGDDQQASRQIATPQRIPRVWLWQITTIFKSAAQKV